MAAKKSNSNSKSKKNTSKSTSKKYKKGKKGAKVSYGDDWRIVYHRINPGFLKDGPGVHREVCVDVMKFDKNGNIIPVVPTN